jgi:hypothetical protein
MTITSTTSTTAISIIKMTLEPLEHQLEVGDENPAACTPRHSCRGHAAADHVHDPGCGHEPIPTATTFTIVNGFRLSCFGFFR